MSVRSDGHWILIIMTYQLIDCNPPHCRLCQNLVGLRSFRQPKLKCTALVNLADNVNLSTL